MGEMEGMGKRGRWVQQEHRERGVWQVHVGQLVFVETQVCKETQDWKDLKVHEVLKENKVCKDFMESQDCRVHQQEEQSTLAGAVPPAPLSRELHSSTLEELERHVGSTEEEQQTISVYQMIQTISSTRVECRALAILLE